MTAATEAGEKPPLVFHYQTLLSIVVWVFVALGSFNFIEPSPHDLTFLIAVPLWALGGFTVHRSFLLIAFLLIVYNLLGFLALIPYWSNPDSAMYQYQSAYLVTTALFFALYLGNRTVERTDSCFGAFNVSSVFTAIFGILGYFNVNGWGDEVFAHAGRAMGTFKDPNVFGSYVILTIVCLAQELLFARARSFLLTSTLLLITFAGMFLSFSRGSYISTLIAIALMMGSAFVTTTEQRMRRRVVVVSAIAIALIALTIAALLSIPETREVFEDRTSGLHEYDVGETGRFGNQIRSLPMLVERFWGFGPLRFRYFFEFDPHNSYVGAFANNGWFGGLFFLLIIGASTFVSLRLMFKESPVQRQAQALAPVLLTVFLQGFQIDVDHWRHVFFLLGAIWGLEAARQRWADAHRAVVASDIASPTAPSSA